MKQGQQFRHTIADVLAGLALRPPLSLPAISCKRHRLKWPGFIFRPHRLRIVDFHRAAFTLAQDLPGLAPTAGARPTKTSLLQDGANRVGTDLGQAIRRLAQSLSQAHQRPIGGAVLLRVWSTPDFGEDALTLCHCILGFRPTAWLTRNR